MTAYVPADLRRRVRERYGNCCAHFRTAESLTVATFEIEHIVPRSAGGSTVLENLCLACPTCNRHKAHRTAAVDPDTLQEVPLYSPYQDVWTEHFVWSDDATTIVGLTATGRATIAALRMNRSQVIRVRKMWVSMGVHPPGLQRA
jgi:hypothetical protein